MTGRGGDRTDRIKHIAWAGAACLIAVALRLVYLQVGQHAALSARAERQQESIVTLEPKRGTIYDRQGRELAVSVDAESVYVVPAAVSNPRSLASRLAAVLDEDSATVLRKLASGKDFAWLGRKVDPARVERVRALGLGREIGFVRESRRYYPKKTLAGSVLGFTGLDNEGLEGIERAYDRDLRGMSSRHTAVKDGGRRIILPGGTGLQFTMPVPGSDVVLTIDEVIQHIAEKELDRALAEHRALGGVCIVMVPQTGELLALSVRASSRAQGPFNPNSPQQFRPAEWRNRAVTDAYEPGSIFKPVLAAAALEEKAVHPLERFDCSAGSIRVADRTIKDAHRNGVLTFSDVIAESSNVGTIKVSQRLGKEKFGRYIEAFGFGRRTGVDLPGEIAGLVKDPQLWSGVSLASISIGQEIGVTPIQMAAAYGAIANGGTLMRPYVVSSVSGPEGTGRRSFGPTQSGRVVSEATSRTLAKILQRVVEHGTGQKARPSGYTAAGKTGTAQKIDQRTGRYSKDDFVSSFVGFVPASAPRLVIVVMIDSPGGVAWGGSVAGPVFRAVAEQSLAYLQVPPDDAEGRMLLVGR